MERVKRFVTGIENRTGMEALELAGVSAATAANVLIAMMKEASGDNHSVFLNNVLIPIGLGFPVANMLVNLYKDRIPKVLSGASKWERAFIRLTPLVPYLPLLCDALTQGS